MSYSLNTCQIITRLRVFTVDITVRILKCRRKKTFLVEFSYQGQPTQMMSHQIKKRAKTL